MTAPRPEKVAEVEELEQRLRSSPVVILTDYRGLTVTEIGALRGRLREASLEYRVAKNTLLSRAAERAGVPGLSAFLTGPTAVVFGREDPGPPARILQEFIRQYRKLAIKGGVIEGEALGPQDVQSLAGLPTKPELVAWVIGAIQGPLRGLVIVLNATPRALLTALDAVRKQREAAGGGPADARPGEERATQEARAEAGDGTLQPAAGEAAQEPRAVAEAGPAETPGNN